MEPSISSPKQSISWLQKPSLRHHGGGESGRGGDRVPSELSAAQRPGNTHQCICLMRWIIREYFNLSAHARQSQTHSTDNLFMLQMNPRIWIALITPTQHYYSTFTTECWDQILHMDVCTRDAKIATPLNTCIFTGVIDLILKLNWQNYHLWKCLKMWWRYLIPAPAPSTEMKQYIKIKIDLGADSRPVAHPAQSA